MEQLHIFTEHGDLPSGASLKENFLDPETELELLAWIDVQKWSDELKRRVQHYGYRYDYKARKVDRRMFIGELPVPLKNLAISLKEAEIFVQTPDQIIVNEYLPGQGIAAHVDCQPCFGETIASLTLGSGSEMQFTQGRKKIGVFLPRRSLIQLMGEARHDWKHGIPSRKSDMVNGIRVPRVRRVSLTFRNVTLIQ